ncbi:MAG: hypothetical protein RBT49_11775 [Bacteroidales bacterium]|jgi:hypothetical protein|nr:hypothetical protein [Bacteroidales bacterium]
MKTLKITAEWILDTYPMYVSADGNGIVTIITAFISDARWIELALNSLNIYYESYEMVDDDSEYYELGWEIDIEDIKDICPNLYKDWQRLNSMSSTNPN